MLDRAFRQARGLRERLGQRVGARVVAADRHVQRRVRSDEPSEHALERGIGRGLAREHGRRPPRRLGDDGLVVPVRALHEPHLVRDAARTRERDEGVRVSVGLAQVGLEHDPRAGPAAEALAARERAREQLPREVAVLELLHVDRDADARAVGRLDDRLERRAGARDRALGIDGAEVRGERGELERDLEREHAARRHLARRGVGGELPDQFDVAREVRLGLAFAEHGLPEQVERGEAAVVTQLADRPGHRVGAWRGDEASREQLGRAPRGFAHDARGHALVAGESQQPAQPARQLRELVSEVLGGEPLRLRAAAVVVDRREHVQIAQQAAPEALVRGGQAEQPVLDALRRTRPVAPGLGEQLASELLRALLDADRAHRPTPLGVRGDVPPIRYHCGRTDRDSAATTAVEGA